MPVTTLPFTNGFYKADSLPVSAQECVNAYPVPMEAPALSPEILVGTPGISLIESTGNFAYRNRGAIEMGGVVYAVNGPSLYKIDQVSGAFVVTSEGSITGTSRVSMAHNGTQLVVLVPGSTGYVYNRLTDTLVEITDTDFRANGNPLYVQFVDGYFVFTTDDDRFIISALNDGTSYNALDFGAAESDPDSIVAPIVYRNQLFITGKQTIEGFQNIGGADFPFQRTGLFVDKGVYAPNSLIKTQEGFMFVGGGLNESASIWLMQGNGVAKVSTRAIDLLLQDVAPMDLEGIYAWTYAQRGSFFVGFVLPSTTIVYDFLSKRWHERKSFDDSGLSGGRVSAMVAAFNRVICLDNKDGRIGELDADVYTEYGNAIIRRFVTQPFQNNMQAIFVPSLELTIESGVGNSDAEDPHILMERSIDGRTWQAPRTRPMGKIGEYKRRAIWTRNGRASRLELFRFTVSAPVKFIAAQLTANIVGGTK